MGKQKRVTVDFIFEEQVEEFGDESYSYYELVGIERQGSGVSEGDLKGWVEAIAQSDYGYIDFPNDVWTAMEGENVKFE